MRKRLLIFAVLLSFFAPWFRPAADAHILHHPSVKDCPHNDMCPMKERAAGPPRGEAAGIKKTLAGHNGHIAHDGQGRRADQPAPACRAVIECAGKKETGGTPLKFFDTPFIASSVSFVFYEPSSCLRDNAVKPYRGPGKRDLERPPSL